MPRAVANTILFSNTPKLHSHTTSPSTLKPPPKISIPWIARGVSNACNIGPMAGCFDFAVAGSGPLGSGICFNCAARVCRFIRRKFGGWQRGQRVGFDQGNRQDSATGGTGHAQTGGFTVDLHRSAARTRDGKRHNENSL